MENMQIVVACKNNVEAQYVEMMVPLYSYGCERKVKKALSHLKGIYSVNVDFNQQKVTVWGICNKYDVLSTIRSKRKGAKFWNNIDDNNIIDDHDHHDDGESQQSIPPKLHKTMTFSFSRPSLSLTKFRSFNTKFSSLNWKGMKKIFDRSYSF